MLLLTASRTRLNQCYICIVSKLSTVLTVLSGYSPSGIQIDFSSWKQVHGIRYAESKQLAQCKASVSFVATSPWNHLPTHTYVISNRQY